MNQHVLTFFFADCAVCTAGFAPGIAHSCHECSDTSKQLAVALAPVVGLSVLLVTALLCWNLGTVKGETAGEDMEVGGSFRGSNRWSCSTFPMRMLPLAATKIVVTVWQILYQVCKC